MQGQMTLSGSAEMDLITGWLLYQLEAWCKWAAGRDEAWIQHPTGNERHPTLGRLFLHAWTPMHRYADQMLGSVRADAPDPPPEDFTGLDAWAGQCLQRFEEAARLLPALADRSPRTYLTRSAGELKATPYEVLMHAALHCIWHLAGLAHLLRQAGIAPPPNLDLILFANLRHSG